MLRYRTLNSNSVIATLEKLEQGIADRFPSAGLLEFCRELLEAARHGKARIAAIEAPNYLLRAISIASMVCGMLLLANIGTIIEVKRDSECLYGVLQDFDSAFNIVVLTGAGSLFLSSFESRWKRQQVLGHLHELRSIINVTNMHQVTKASPPGHQHFRRHRRLSPRPPPDPTSERAAAPPPSAPPQTG